MTAITQGVNRAEFLLSEANGERSRAAGTLAITAAALPAGQILGIVTLSGEYAPYDDEADDGTETAAAVLLNPAPVSAAAQPVALIVRDAEVAEALLTGLDAAGEADLLTLGIVCR